MSWALFWFVAFCFVTTLRVLDNVEGIRARFLSRSAKTSRRARAGSADEFVRQAADAAARARAANGIGRAAANVTGSALSFLWKWKVPLLALALFIAGAGVLRSCSPFDFTKSKDTLRAERDAAESEIAVKDIVIDRNEDIGAIASEVAALRAQLREISNRGRDEIAAAAPANEAPVDPDTVAAFRHALDELCYPRADGSRADSCRSSA